MNTPTEVIQRFKLVRAEKAVEAGNFDEAERLSLGVLEIFETMKSPAGDTLTFDKEIQAQELKIEGYLLVRVFLTLGIVANRRGNYPLALDR